MEKQNLTLSLPKEIRRRAKVQAAKENESLTRFAQEAIEQKLNESSGYAASRRRHKKILKEDMDLGPRGDLAVDRESLHERG